MNDNHLTGLHAMSNAEYHNMPHISSSGFKLMARSPLHYWHGSPLNPDRERKEPSRVMVMGTAWHTAVFEPTDFDGTYAAKPDIAPTSTVAVLLADLLAAGLDDWKARHSAIPQGLGKTTKDGKALIAELQERGITGVEFDKYAQVMELAPDLIGKTLLSADDLAAVDAMAAAARAHPITRAIFSIAGGVAEQSIFWIDAETGAPCRIRPDYMLPPCPQFPNGLIIDGKSNADSSPQGFARSAWDGEMFYQAAFYSDGFQQQFKTERPPLFAWMAQERDAPHATAYYSAPADFVEYGRRRYRHLLRVYASCLQSGDWPGYTPAVVPIDLPVWAAKAIDTAVTA